MPEAGEMSGNAQLEAMNRYHAQQDQIEELAKHIKHVILVMSGKGGVGKSTVAVNVAAALQADGTTVGLLDADLHGPNTQIMTGTQDARLDVVDDKMVPAVAHNGVKVVSIAMMLDGVDTPIIWRGPMRTSALRQFVSDVAWGELDYLIVDLPPGTGDEAMSVAQMFPAADGIVIVTTPQKVSQHDCRKAITFAHKMNLPVIGVIENMSGFVCPHCGEMTPLFGQGGGEEMARDMGEAFLGALPLVPEVVSMADNGKALDDEATPATIRDAFAAVVVALKAHLQ